MSRAVVAGDALLHPVALVALAALIINDHVLKFRAPGVVSGKLSDFAILVVGPLVLQGAVEVALSLRRRAWGPSRRAALIACAVTGVAYALEKSFAPATAAYRYVWGALRWPLDALAAVTLGHAWPAMAPVAAVTDLTDLVALPALALAWRVHLDRASGAARVARATDR